MRNAILILVVSMTFVACGGGLGSDEAREILMKSDAVKQLAPRVHVPEGKMIRTIVETGSGRRAVAMGWVRCTPIDIVRVDCRLTSEARGLSSGWTRETSSQYPGWWAPAGSVDMTGIRVDQVSDDTVEVMFFARQVPDEVGVKFGRKPAKEGKPYSATMQKTGEEWKVVGLRELVRLGG